MTVASIDIGSNTVLLLIAKVDDKTFCLLDSKTIYRIPRISEGVKENMRINPKREALLFDTLKEFDTIINEENCDVVLLVATNAFRLAENANEIIGRIRNEFDWETRIISGEEEAKLTFLGAAFPFQWDQNKAVIDIGGGSTEIIHGNSTLINYKNSFSLGVVSLKETFLKHNPPLDDEVNKAVQYIDEIFHPIRNRFSPVETIAVAGTPTTLACIKNKIQVYDDSLVDNGILSRCELQSFISELREMTYDHIKEKYGEVVIGREDVLLAGALILEKIMGALKLNQVTVSSKGLRYGVVYDYLNKTNSLSGI